MTFRSLRQQQKLNNFRQRYKSQARATHSFIRKKLEQTIREILIFLSVSYDEFNVGTEYFFLHKIAFLF